MFQAAPKHKKLREVRSELAVEKELTPELLSKFRHLKKVKLFSDLEEQEQAISEIALMMEERTFSPGDKIIKEGDMGMEMYILTSGQASVFKSTTAGDLYKVAIFSGDGHPFFGEGAMLEADARSATIQADTECHCLVLSREQFLAFSRKHPEWALPILYRIARSVMERLKKMNLDLALLYNALVAEIRGHY